MTELLPNPNRSDWPVSEEGEADFYAALAGYYKRLAEFAVEAIDDAIGEIGVGAANTAQEILEQALSRIKQSEQL